MTGTLIKHEAIRTRGFLLVIAAAGLGSALIGSLLALTGWPILSVLGTVIGFIGAFALVPAMQLAQAVDYWRTGYGRIGYFTQTLPVRGSRIYWAKLAWAGLTLLAALILTLAAWFGVMVASAQGLFGMPPGEMLAQAGEILGAAYAAAPWLVAVGAPVILVVLYGFNTALLLFSASVGSERWLQRLGWGGPVLVWFGSYAIVQVVLFVLILAIPFGLGVDASGSFGIVPANLLEAMITNTDAQVMPIGFLPAMAALIPVFLWRTARSWNHKVSLA